jgi:hypothetical protein
MSNRTDHVFHVWINSEAGPKDKPTEMPLEPHKDGLYSFKAAMQMMPWLTAAIGRERRKQLPLVHQQCSHSPPEPIAEEYLTCALGQKLRECPILQRLADTFAEWRAKSYYSAITDEQVDAVKAQTCLWHMLMGNNGAFVDWMEGPVQTVSDRMFWQRVYDHMSTPVEEPDHAP